ncbi:MAG: hypothetical protein L0215_10410 [Gemmataceae bacterium]|nr:hypothetical protein [Gemmataceae bacterium]
MAGKTKAKRVVLRPEHPPDSFTRADLLKAIKKIAAARRLRHGKIPQFSTVRGKPSQAE